MAGNTHGNPSPGFGLSHGQFILGAGRVRQKARARGSDRLVAESKTADSWFVEGVCGELAERYLDEADPLVWLDIPWDICKARLLARGSLITPSSTIELAAIHSDDLDLDIQQKVWRS